MSWFVHDLGWWGYALMLIGMLVFWATAIAGATLLVRGIRRGEPFHDAPAAEQSPPGRRAHGELERSDRATPERLVRS